MDPSGDNPVQDVEDELKRLKQQQKRRELRKQMDGLSTVCVPIGVYAHTTYLVVIQERV